MFPELSVSIVGFQETFAVLVFPPRGNTRVTHCDLRPLSSEAVSHSLLEAFNPPVLISPGHSSLGAVSFQNPRPNIENANEKNILQEDLKDALWNKSLLESQKSPIGGASQGILEFSVL